MNCHYITQKTSCFQGAQKKPIPSLTSCAHSFTSLSDLQLHHKIVVACWLLSSSSPFIFTLQIRQCYEAAALHWIRSIPMQHAKMTKCSWNASTNAGPHGALQMYGNCVNLRLFSLLQYTFALSISYFPSFESDVSRSSSQAKVSTSHYLDLF